MCIPSASIVTANLSVCITLCMYVCHYYAVHFLHDIAEPSSSIGILSLSSICRSRLNTAANSSKRVALTLSSVTPLSYCAMLVTPLSCIPHGTIAC
jgi:hypothetical protein